MVVPKIKDIWLVYQKTVHAKIKMFMKTSQECYCLLNKSLNIKIHIFAHNGNMHQDISVPIILSKYNSNSLCKKITRQK